MAVLTTLQRQDTTAQFVQAFFVELAHTADLGSDEVLTLVGEIDAWLDANTTAANNAIDVTLRAKASTSTKFAALAYVSLKRAGII